MEGVVNVFRNQHHQRNSPNFCTDQSKSILIDFQNVKSEVMNPKTSVDFSPQNSDYIRHWSIVRYIHWVHCPLYRCNKYELLYTADCCTCGLRMIASSFQLACVDKGSGISMTLYTTIIYIMTVVDKEKKKLLFITLNNSSVILLCTRLAHNIARIQHACSFKTEAFRLFAAISWP